MSVTETEEKKCRVIQIMKHAEHVNKLCYITFYITAETATGSVLDLTL